MVAKRNYKVNVKRNWCKECDICVTLCPKGVLKKDKDGKAEAVYPEECVGCMICELHCPDFAIYVNEKEDPDKEGAKPIK